MSLETNLEAYCNAAGITVEDVAGAAGVTMQTMSNWIAGRTSPTVAMLERLAEPLGCEGADLIAASPPAGILAELIDAINELEEENRYLRQQVEKTKSMYGRYLF